MSKPEQRYALPLVLKSAPVDLPTPASCRLNLRELQLAAGAEALIHPGSLEVRDRFGEPSGSLWAEDRLAFYFQPARAPYTLHFDTKPLETPPSPPPFIGAGEPLMVGYPGREAELGLCLHGRPILLDWTGTGQLQLLTWTHPTMHKGGVYLHLAEATLEGREAPLRQACRVPDFVCPVVRIPDAPSGEVWCIAMQAGGELHKGKVEAGWPVFQEPVPLITTEGRVVFDGITEARPFVVDWDGDGVWDLLIGGNDWSEYYPFGERAHAGIDEPHIGFGRGYDDQGNWLGGPLHGKLYFARNVGTPQAPLFEPPVQLKVEGVPFDVYGAASPVVADWAGDGHPVLFVADFLGAIRCYRPTENPLEVEYLGKLEGQYGGYPLPQWMVTLDAWDWTGTGLPDLLAGTEGGNIMVLENAGVAPDGMPQVRAPRYLREGPGCLTVHCKASVSVADWDADGDFDLLLANAEGDLLVSTDRGKPGRPLWSEPVPLLAGGVPFHIEAGPGGSIQGPSEDRWGYLNVTVSDWRDGGLPDLITCDVLGQVLYFANIGPREAPVLAAPVPFTWQGKPFKTVWRQRPQAVRRFPDKPQELLCLDQEGYLTLYQRAPDDPAALISATRLHYESGEEMKLDGFSGLVGRSKFAVCDWDADGDFDLLLGLIRAQPLAQPEGKATVLLIENVGTTEAPVFAKPRKLLCGGAPMGFGCHSATPEPVDLTGDGRLDLLIGSENGKVYCYSRRYLETGCELEIGPG